ncbi:hypothetical protein GF391_00145 [Candidatus Uhrbacteria bacterium]|nr:hypothetical protein [Candidatus Uhrbacteria bacterium]
MELSRSFFIWSARALMRAGAKLNINHLVQYRFLLSLRATAQMALFLACVYIFTELHNLHPRADAVSYIFLFCFSACMGVIMAMQCRAILAADRKLLAELRAAEIDGKSITEYLQIRHMQVFSWMLIAIFFGTAFLIAASNLKLLFIFLGLPVILDTIIVLTLISWELLLWQKAQASTKTD